MALSLLERKYPLMIPSFT